MKDFILLILNITAFACGLGAVASVLSFFFGWTIRFKGAEVPGDLKATAMFLIMGAAAGGIVHLVGRKKPQNQPE